MAVQKMTQTHEGDSILEDLIDDVGPASTNGKVLALADRHMQQANAYAVNAEDISGIDTGHGRGLAALALLHEQRAANLLQLVRLHFKN